MSITYTIAIDYNHDGDFTDAGDDITTDVIDLQWTLGMARPYDSLAEASTAQITVRNPSGTFSPERNTLKSGTRVRIQSNDGTTTRTHFTGYIRHIEPEAGEWGKKTAVIHLQDIQPWLAESPVTAPTYVDVTADIVVDDLLDRAILRRAVIGGYCIIDVDGYNQIDSVSIFGGDNVARTLETGVSQFAYVGDWWQESVPIRQAIQDVVSSEHGRFYINRDGDVIFRNRRYTLLNKTIAATFSNDMQNIDYTYGDERINRLAITMTPREIGGSETTIWQLDQPQLVPAQTQFTLNLHFTDEQNQPIGLLELDDLITAFYRSESGTGSPVTDDVSVEIIQQGFTSMGVQISNTGIANLYLIDLTVKGTPLYRCDPLEIVVSDGEGMHIYGLKTARWDLPALSNIEIAQAFASYEILRRKHPSGTIQTLTTITRDHPIEVLSLTLFDRIRITESQTGQTAQDYFIIRESHHVSKGGTYHTVTWTLEPADSTRFVIIDSSNIDDTVQVIVPY